MNYHKIVHRFTTVSLESGSSHCVQAMNFLMMPVAKMSSLTFTGRSFGLLNNSSTTQLPKP